MENPVPRATNPKTRVQNPAAREAGEICPNCGGALDQRQCKLFCSQCGVLVYNCSEF